MDQNPEGGFSASITYAELKAHFDQHEGAELDPQQRRNRLSGLKKYQDSCGRADTDAIGPELNGQFEQRRAAFLAVYANPGTAGNLKSCLSAWKGDYDELLALKLPFGSFAAALTHYVASAKAKNPNLTMQAIADVAGISRRALLEWRSKTQHPTKCLMAAIEKLEKVLETPQGALTRFVRSVSMLQLELKRRCATPSRARQAKFTSNLFRLPENQFSGELVRNWAGYVSYKTDEEACGLERKHSWKSSPVAEYQGLMWVLPYLMTDGEKFAPSADIVFGYLRTFFGALAATETAPAVPKYDPHNFSLVWLADCELVKEGIKQLKSRYGGHTSTSKGILNFALSLVHPITGFVTQHPEFGKNLARQVEEAAWSSWCAAQHAATKKYITRLIEGKHFVEKTRDPFEPIQDYIDRQHPISILYELKESISRFIADHPSMPETVKKPLERNLFMIELEIEQPLRVKMLAIMEYREDNKGHLYKRADGTYAVRMNKKLWKNERGAAQHNYDVPFRPEFTTKVDDYLQKVKPWFQDERSLVFVASDSDRRQTRVRTLVLNTAFRACTLRFLPGCIGFGPHCVRHLVATEYIRNCENGWQTAADVLHDTLATVKMAYARIKPEDGHQFYKSYLTEFEKTKQ